MKRNKACPLIVADQLVKLIKEADHVVIMGHRMSDLDAIGSAEGVLRICKICDVPAVIAVRRDATLAGSLINALIAAGQEDDFIQDLSRLYFPHGVFCVYCCQSGILGVAQILRQTSGSGTERRHGGGDRRYRAVEFILGVRI